MSFVVVVVNTGFINPFTLWLGLTGLDNNIEDPEERQGGDQN